MVLKFSYFTNKEKKNKIVPETESEIESNNSLSLSNSFEQLVNIFEFNCLSRRKIVDFDHTIMAINEKYVDVIVKELIRAKERMDDELKADLSIEPSNGYFSIEPLTNDDFFN